MAQFDVHRLDDGTLVVDCQSDSLEYLNTRVVAPLLPADRVPTTPDRLHPTFTVESVRYLLATQLVATLQRKDLGPSITSLAQDRYTVTGAFDRLLTGV